MTLAAQQYDTEEGAFYRWGVQDSEDRRRFLHNLEAESGIPAELSDAWDKTMERFLP